MLRLHNLTYRYAQLSMRFSLHICAGERVAVVGPSGAGKSTLLSLIAGFLPAEEGEIWLANRQYTHSPPSARPVSILFQENNLFPHLTVAQNIGLGLHPGLKLSREQHQAVTLIAERVGLHTYLQRLPGALSGGQRQRAALARCLIRQRPLLLLDEPFAALDPALRKEMLQLVEDVCRERCLTLLMVTHNHDDARQIARRSIVIVNGSIARDGETETVLHHDAQRHTHPTSPSEEAG